MVRGKRAETPNVRSWRRRSWWGVLVLVLAIAVLVWELVDRFPAGADQHAWFVVLAAMLGATAGASELISRYRDEPLSAVASRAGMAYVGVNASVSALTYGLLTEYSSSLLPALASDRLLTSVVAGFGSMAVLRSKFFTLRTSSGEDIAVGPDAVVSAFLDAADRGVDRARAARRIALVFEYAQAATHPEKGRDFLEISIAAFQNLNKEQKVAFVQRLNAITASGYPARLQLQAICYELLSLTGEDNFRDLMANLETYSSREN
jgi:hypothetical protein